MSHQLSIFDRPTDADITRRKHGGHRMSVKAHARIVEKKPNARAQMMGYLTQHSTGTVKEMAAAFGKLPHQISGRASDLKKAGWIEETLEEREGYSVLRRTARAWDGKVESL